MLDRVVRLALMVCLHALVELLERLLRKLPVVFGGIDQVRVAALDPPGKGSFLALGRGTRVICTKFVGEVSGFTFVVSLAGS